MKNRKELIKEFVDLVLTDENQPILESVDQKKKILLDDKELEFGCPEHIDELKKCLTTLGSLKDCFKRGTSVRMIVSNCMTKIKAIVDKYELKEQTIEQQL